jgi:geranylgeranyl pyrophosphate synthase
MTLFGWHFQIRDDYQNLASADVSAATRDEEKTTLYHTVIDHVSQYEAQKGFCEDLDEGKLSLPLLHALHKSPDDTVLLSIMQMRKHSDGLSKKVKEHALEKINSKGGLEYTRDLLQQLQRELLCQTETLEKRAGAKNWILRQVLQQVEVKPGTQDKTDSGGKSRNKWLQHQTHAWASLSN